MKSTKRIAIIVGGGPAPGINGVISSATIKAIEEGREVIGILDGYKSIMRGDISKIKFLTIDEVSRLHFRGGSYIGTARDNPTTDEKFLQTTVNSLLRLNVDKVITIGGDDTAFSALSLAQISNGRIHVVHVPKTIDNDLNLPYGIPTFGYQTARHVGAKLLENLMVDAVTTSRWYFLISMGRSAGHLALGIGKSAGATFTLIPEEFPEEKVKLKKIVDIICGSIIKRLSYDKSYGVGIIAEGLVYKIDEDDLSQLKDVERDDHGHIRIAEIDFGGILKSRVQAQLRRFGIKMTIVSKNMGYELRCADPIPFDIEYTRDLGFNAADFVLRGGNSSLISIQNSEFVPIPLESMINPETGRMKVRRVDINSENFKVAFQYMVRLKPEDFQDPHEIAKFAATCNISIEEFKKMFSYTLKEGFNNSWTMDQVDTRVKKYIEKFGNKGTTTKNMKEKTKEKKQSKTEKTDNNETGKSNK